MTTEREILDQRQEFIDQRASGIGATDSPKILGLSKWGTALTVYNEKVNPTAGEMSLPAWLGLKLQNTVAELYTAATGHKLRADNRHHRHKEHGWLVCHLDFRVWGEPALLVECKTRAYMTGYGPDGSTEIPADVWVQVQHEMAVTGANRCDVAVLFGHHTFRVYPITRDQPFIEKMIPRLRDFYFYNVVPRVPPAPTGHDMDSAAVKAAHPSHDDELKPATSEQILLMRRLRVARAALKDAETAKAEVENLLKEAIGDAAGLVGPDGSVTWKKNRDSESVDWEQVAVTYGNIVEELERVGRDLSNHLEQLTGTRLPSQDEALARALSTYEVAVSLATHTRPGSRTFRADFKEE